MAATQDTWTPPDPVAIRMEVDMWWQSKEQIHAYQRQLFVEALLYFQKLPMTNPMSYFQIAGIHGQPWIPWGENTVAKTPYRGYCTHGSVLFPTWHRPYMLLFEKALTDIMIDVIILRYPDVGGLIEQLKTAATQWRLPYWDWAQTWKDDEDKAVYRVPYIVRDKELYITTSTGWTKIRNPINQFVMPKKEPMGAHGIHSYKTPNNEHYDYSAPNHTKLEAALTGHEWYENHTSTSTVTNPRFKDTLAEAVYRFFSEGHFTDYGNFASTTHDSGSKNKKHEDFLSLEAVHNNAHNWIGGFGINPDTGALVDGHMAEVPISAFDPIFWLHHSVDRYFAIWQELNEKSWFDPNGEPDSDGTWTIAKNSFDTPAVELRPFNMLNTASYTSSSARDVYSLGYSYPECQPWLDKYKDSNNNPDKTKYIEDMKKQLNNLYVTSANLYLKDGNSGLRAGSGPFEDYIVNVVYDRFELDGLPFCVHILLKPAEKVSLVNQHMNPDHVGIVYNFSTPTPRTGDVLCANCTRQREAKALSTGQVPITSALISRVQSKAIDLPSMRKEAVEAWLKDNLSWRVTLKGREIPLEEMKSLTVGVAVGQAQHARGQLSKFNGYKYLTGATEGKHKGMKLEDGTLMASS